MSHHFDQNAQLSAQAPWMDFDRNGEDGNGKLMTGLNKIIAPKLLAHLAMELDKLTQGLSVGSQVHVLPAADICSSLELFLPAILRKNFAEWEWEILDAIFVARAIKTGINAIEIVGICIVISDQTTTPFSVELSWSRMGESGAITVNRLHLGEPGEVNLGSLDRRAILVNHGDNWNLYWIELTM